MIPRTPPLETRRYLRREVNFGCPVEGCGVPYLKWHHFDPSWSVQEHQNPQGMIALCAKHADLADGGRYTKFQLQKMKKNPYLKDKISASYDYLREEIIADIGAIGINVRDILEIDCERVIGFEKDSDGRTRLNLRFRNSEGKIILDMNNNDWIVFGRNLFDFECPPQGKELRPIAKDKKTNLTIRFDEYERKDFREYLLNNEYRFENVNMLMSDIIDCGLISVLKIRGTLQYGDRQLCITDLSIKETSNQISFTRCSAVNSNLPVVSMNGYNISFG